MWFSSNYEHLFLCNLILHFHFGNENNLRQGQVISQVFFFDENIYDNTPTELIFLVFNYSVKSDVFSYSYEDWKTQTNPSQLIKTDKINFIFHNRFLLISIDQWINELVLVLLDYILRRKAIINCFWKAELIIKRMYHMTIFRKKEEEIGKHLSGWLNIGHGW